MGLSPFDPLNEPQATANAVYNKQQVDQHATSSDPVVAKRIAQIYKNSPYIPANVILAMAKQGVSDAAVNAIAPAAGKLATTSNDPYKPKNKSWFQRNVTDNFKTVSRWSFAALQVAPELAQNLAAEAFSPNDSAGMDGFFRSTTLGSMMAGAQGSTIDVTNPDGTITKKSIDSGSGFFAGEDVSKSQAQKAREFRGEINGHAWTVGRGAASLMFTPGSKPYSVLSGFVDAAFNVASDPTTYAGPLLKEMKAAKAAIPALTGATALSAAEKLAYHGSAGLTAAERASFNGSKFGQFITQDKRAVRLTERLAQIGGDSTKTIHQKTLDILTEFNDSISPEIAGRFAEADSTDKVRGLLGEASARLTQDPNEILMTKDIRDFRLAKGKLGGLLDDTAERVPLYRSIRNSKWFTDMPSGTVVVGGTGMDRTKAIRTYSNYIIGAGIKKDSEKYVKLMDTVVNAYGLTDPSVARDAMHKAFSETFETVFKEVGGDKKSSMTVLQRILSESRKELEKIRTYTIDEAGVVTDGGAFQAMAKDLPKDILEKFTPDQQGRLVFQGPGSLGEMADEMFVLPNYRQVRRLAGSLKFATTNKLGEQRNLITVAEFIQNDIWKPLSLATGGYLMRNLADSQVRIAMTGLDGLFNHPIDYIQWMMRRGKGFADIVGKDFDISAEELAKAWSKEQPEYAAAMTHGITQHYQDPMAAFDRNLNNHNWGQVSRSADSVAHTTGYVDNLALINSDPLNGKIAQYMASGDTQPEAINKITSWLNSPAGKDEKKRVIEFLRQNPKVIDPKDPTVYGFIKFPEEISDELVSEWVQKFSSIKINTITRGDNELGIIAAHNRVPITIPDIDGKLTAIRPEPIDIRDLRLQDFVSGDGDIGSIIALENGNEGVVLKKVGTELTVQEVHPGSAFSKDGLGTEQLRTLVDQKGVDGKLAEIVKRAERAGAPGKTDSVAQKALGVKDHLTDKIFKDMFGTVTQKLERSPVFRQFYYREVGASAELLAPKEAQKLLDHIDNMVKEFGIRAENYVGDKETLKKLRSIAKSSSDATGTLEELDSYAKAVALKASKDTLFDATSRNNLQDVLRIVIPFGTAWTEVLGSYVKIAVEDPTRIRRAQLMFEGGRKADMSIVGGQQGQGFFYKDATTGDYTFNLPGSGWATQLVTGVKAPLQAPIKGLSLGFNFNPGVGPVLQAAASAIIPDTPSTDWMVKMFLPYGRTKGVPLTPRWVSQLSQVIRGDTMNLETTYGNTYMETIRAMAATGEYDLSSETDKTRLFADARKNARIITGLRTFAQFIGPTSPSVEFSIDTKDGDIYGTQLIKEFQKLQTNNYDTAVSEFLRIYGKDAMIYLSNKTESVSGGLEASQQFGDWERTDGKKIMKSFPDVAGFMAEGGDDFSFEVWSRQLKKGERRRLTDREMIAAAQYKTASAQYRDLRKQLPVNPSSEQSAWLRSWRIQLNKEYPGFPVISQFNPGEFPGKISQLKDMLKDPSLKDNDIAIATQTYLDRRDDAIAQYVQSGGAESGMSSANSAAPLRDWLAQWGRSLVNETPEFARIYDRLLSYEVEQ